MSFGSRLRQAPISRGWSGLYHRLSGQRGVAAELPIIRSCSVIHESESHIGFAGPPPENCGDRRTSEMQYVCDAPNGKVWFRIETEGEAVHESRLMSHTVEKYFRREREKAVQSWRPARPNAIERDIGLEAHVQREMPLFLTLRDREGNALTTAMLPPGGKDRGGFRIIIVAASNADPYPQQDAAIAALGAHFGLTLDRDRCFPYGR